QKIYDRSKLLFVIAAAVASVLMVLFGIWVARSISGPLGELRRTMENAERSRDLTMRVPVNRGDEIGQVARAYHSMMERFRAIIGDVRDTAGQLEHASQQLSSTT